MLDVVVGVQVESFKEIWRSFATQSLVKSLRFSGFLACQDFAATRNDFSKIGISPPQNRALCHQPSTRVAMATATATRKRKAHAGSSDGSEKRIRINTLPSLGMYLSPSYSHKCELF